MHLSRNPTDEDILTFVEQWIDDLANGNYESAYGRTEHDPYFQWTPELMRSVVQGYGSPTPHQSGKIFVVSPRQSARFPRGHAPQCRVDREAVRPPAFARALHDLPLNGEWSDLTATFRIEPRGENGSAVILEEIHVF